LPFVFIEEEAEPTILFTNRRANFREEAEIRKSLVTVSVRHEYKSFAVAQVGSMEFKIAFEVKPGDACRT